MNTVENAVERIHIPAGCQLTVRSSSPGATASIALADGNVSLAAQSVASGSFAVVGPFTVPVDVTISAQGEVSADVRTVGVLTSPFASLPTTGNTIGEVREISDGAWRGYRVRWGIPEGETLPTWCHDAFPHRFP
jgi:hypothetical protein